MDSNIDFKNSAFLSILLANACPATEKDGDGFCWYTVELHCAIFQIRARPVGKVLYRDDGSIRSGRWEATNLNRIQRGDGFLDNEMTLPD